MNNLFFLLPFNFPGFRRTSDNFDLIITIQNYEDCNGCGLCADICPDIFAMVKDKVCILRQPELPEQSMVELAKTSCPNNCIVTNWDNL